MRRKVERKKIPESSHTKPLWTWDLRCFRGYGYASVLRFRGRLALAEHLRLCTRLRRWTELPIGRVWKAVRGLVIAESSVQLGCSLCQEYFHRCPRQVPGGKGHQRFTIECKIMNHSYRLTQTILNLFDKFGLDIKVNALKDTLESWFSARRCASVEIWITIDLTLDSG